MHLSIPFIGTIIWLLVFGGVVFAMCELIRIDRKILEGKEPKARAKQPVYEHRGVWAGIVLGTIALPILLGSLIQGFSFGRAWFVVSFGFLPWLMASTSVLNSAGPAAVAMIALAIYALLIAFFTLVLRHNQKSTYIGLSVIIVLALIPLYVLSFKIAVSSLLGFQV